MSRSVHALMVSAISLLASGPSTSFAHDGPPYPIVTDHVSGPYRLSVWTDPDTTDDGTAGGQFWIMVDPVRQGDDIPRDIRTRVTIRPLERTGPLEAAMGVPVEGRPSRQFVALRMDHEGRFAVRVDVESSAGTTSVDAEVDATYDLRPQPLMLLIYLVPFLLTGFLWTTLLVRRRRALTRAGPSLTTG